MKDYEKRIAASFLNHCPTHRAYDWLSKNWETPEVGGLGYWKRAELERTHKPLEYLLYRRNDPLIDLGLAQFGWVGFVLKKVFARGNIGVRCAVLASPTLLECQLIHNDPIVDLAEVVKRGNRSELEALSNNPYLSNEFYESFLNREKYFSALGEADYKFMLYRFGDNPRLFKEYDEKLFDGWADYEYHRVFSAAWELAGKVPVTQEWAYILSQLLSNAILPINFKNTNEVIEKWRIDPPKEESDSHHYPGHSFYLRSRLADLLDADDTLLNSPDLALRRSFYRRFKPWDYKNWPDFLEKDGEDFLEEAIRSNPGLWRSQTEREKLSKVAWDFPDPSSDMMMPNLYRARETAFRKEYPNWFFEEDDEYSSQPDAIARKTEKLLKEINEKLETLIDRAN